MAVKRVLFGLLGLGAVTQGSGLSKVPCDSSEEDRRRITESAVHTLRQDGRFYVLPVSGVDARQASMCHILVSFIIG